MGSAVMVKRDLPANTWPLGFTQDGAYYDGFGTTRNDLHVAELDPDTGKVLFTPSPVQLGLIGQVIQPAWSPNGQLLAYRFRGPNMFGRYGVMRETLAIRDWQTGQERHIKLPFPTPHDFPLYWSPDSLSLLTASAEIDGSHHLYQVDIETGKGEVIVENGFGQWSPYGNTVYYVAFGRQRRVLRRDMRNGQEEELYRGIHGWFGLSPDGRSVSFFQDGVVRLFCRRPEENLESCSSASQGRSWAGGRRTAAITTSAVIETSCGGSPSKAAVSPRSSSR